MRPRQFDEDELLTAAFDLFWRRGVRATSMADLAHATGVQRGSLYNAYRDKETIFLAAYAHYADGYLSRVETAMAGGSLRDQLLAFCDVSIANFCDGEPARGCPTTRGLMEVAERNREGLGERAQQAFTELIARVLSMVERAFRDGVSSGEFSGDPVLAAGQLVATVRGLVVLQRADVDEHRLREIATQCVA
ncbi:MAG: TetR/AcrR family transcriptional regulator, partial [Pseudomonadota bacterium]